MRWSTVVIALLVAAPSARASPPVPAEDPVYLELARLRALGRIPAYSGGVRPLAAARVEALLALGGRAAAARPAGWWIEPVRQAALRLDLHRERPRPYSTARRPRFLAGALQVSCERVQGRPCGAGVGLASELDLAAGHRDWLSGFTRLRAVVGRDGYQTDAVVDRAALAAEVGPLALSIGRDAFALGPSRRGALWSDHAPPLDAVRLATARPFDLVGREGDVLRLNGFYAVGRLRAPQTFPGNLVSVARLQLDVVDDVELGVSQVLQLGGEGAPSIDLLDFVAEHVRRRNKVAGADDSSNRRVAFDLSVRLAHLGGARVYYELVYEDMRRSALDALRFDADHLLGVELATIGRERRHGVTIEMHKTGVRSHEHTPRRTGLTSAGRLLGTPLGPDARAAYLEGRVALGPALLSPWLELIRLSSDTYEFVVDGGIARVDRGVAEDRQRVGLAARAPLRDGVWLAGDAVLEHLNDAGFVAGARRNNVGVALTVGWAPRWRWEH